MKLDVYGKEVVFSKEEEHIVKEMGLDLDREFLEIILFWYGVDNFDDVSEESERHDLCINAIVLYYKIILTRIRPEQ